MAPKNIYTDVQVDGNPIDVLTVEVTEGYQQVTARSNIETDDISGVSLNDLVTIDIGYDGDHGQIFTGYIDDIDDSRMPGTYQISCRDVLKLAIETWLVSTDIENPWSRSHISAEDLVHDLLAEAMITNYSGAASGFTFGVQNPAEFNMMSVNDAIRTLCHILAYNYWARNGTVYFDRVFPYPDPGDPIDHSMSVGNTGNIVVIDYNYSTEELRNRVVVFGAADDDIYAEEKVASPYLPAGFYKTAIVSSEFIDTQSMADASAIYNLALYNKLTESMKIEAEGNYRYRMHDIIGVTEPFTGMSGDKWFLYAVTHRVSDQGYTSSLSLTR